MEGAKNTFDFDTQAWHHLCWMCHVLPKKKITKNTLFGLWCGVRWHVIDMAVDVKGKSEGTSLLFAFELNQQALEWEETAPKE